MLGELLTKDSFSNWAEGDGSGVGMQVCEESRIHTVGSPTWNTRQAISQISNRALANGNGAREEVGEEGEWGRKARKVRREG